MAEEVTGAPMAKAKYVKLSEGSDCTLTYYPNTKFQGAETTLNLKTSACTSLDAPLQSWKSSSPCLGETPAPLISPAPYSANCPMASTCWWRATRDCQKDGKREPWRDLACTENRSIPNCFGSSGWCDCNGNNQLDDGEVWRDCNFTVKNTDPSCVCNSTIYCQDVCCTTTTTTTTSSSTTTSTS